MDTDAHLLAHADAPGAFEELVSRHQPVLHRYAARRIGAAAAEDVIAETFAIAYARRGAFEPSRGDVRPWLFGIATNVLRGHHRRERHALEAYARTGVDPLAPGPGAGDAALGAALAAALAGMRREHRDVLLLHAVAELNHSEIAQALGVPEGTVKGWLKRARTAAARELESQGLHRPAPTEEAVG
ncbi:MAG: RNA polymerase sigma factor [Thermoleophilia bacterium]